MRPTACWIWALPKNWSKCWPCCPPKLRQTLLLSATFGPAVQTLVGQLLREGHVSVEVENTHQQDATIAQRAIYVDAARRTSLLHELITQYPEQRILVFVASRYSAEHVANKLYARKIYATAFHGELSQGAREKVLQEFKNHQWQVLITTDLAARGIHIDALPVVVNYDLPRSADDYTHRIGRTGRAGLSGTAISFVSPATQAHWKLIAKRNQLNIELETLPAYPVTEKPQNVRRMKMATMAASKASAPARKTSCVPLQQRLRPATSHKWLVRPTLGTAFADKLLKPEQLALANISFLNVFHRKVLCKQRKQLFFQE